MQATLALRPLLHQVLGVVGGCTQGVGGGGVGGNPASGSLLL